MANRPAPFQEEAEEEEEAGDHGHLMRLANRSQPHNARVRRERMGRRMTLGLDGSDCGIANRVRAACPTVLSPRTAQLS